MHRHEHEESVDQSQPAGRRLPADAELAHLVRAASAGRADVLGRSGVTSLQRAVGNSAVGSVLAESGAEEEQRSPVHDVVGSGGGQPLDPGTRADMETRFGTDFSQVRVHTDGAAHESARSVGAHAYTVGHDVVFQRDRYDPASPEGRTMIAHELTHVVQQRSGPVEGTEAPGGIRVSDPSDRFEREAAACT
jgi:NADPH:quinone reductase-like Zn-dependent oxidoreductase